MILKCIRYKTKENVVAEKFIRALKTKIYKYMTSISKNMHIDKLDDIKIADVKDNIYIYIYCSIELPLMELQDRDPNDRYRRFKVGHHVRISNCKNIFAKGYS